MSESPVLSISTPDRRTQQASLPESTGDDALMSGAQFIESIQIRGPRGLRAAVLRLARRKHSTASEIIRQFIIRGLEAEGVQIQPSVQ